MKNLNKVLMILMVSLTAFIFAKDVGADLVYEALQRNGSDELHYNTSNPVMIPTTYTEKDTEFRGVWVATVYNINIPLHTSETQYKAEFQNLVDEMLESNMNAMLFQVRPLNDAFYDSDYAPFSRYLTGTEGQDPGWDVLAWMISTCHANGIEFHAWMNPYRVANSTSSEATYLSTLHAENFAKQNPNLVISGDVDSNGKNPFILNPGEPAVVQYIENVVDELITDYDVDGIHFDDYFYPYSGMSSDTATYNTYKEIGQSIEDWRRENVNDAVEGVKAVIDTYNTSSGESVQFGISPFGLWGSGIEGSSRTLPGGSNTSTGNTSSYLSQYADSKKWVEEEWLDYICPQVYWAFSHSTAPYADVVDWWASVVSGTSVDLYIGHAPSSASIYSWVTEEISDQLRYNQKHPEITGEVMYSASYLDHAHMQYVELLNWTVTPTNIYDLNTPDVDVSISGTMDGLVYRDSVVVTLSDTETIWYKLDAGTWTLYTTPITVSGEAVHTLSLKTVTAGVDSGIQEESITIEYLNGDLPVISVSGDQIDDDYAINASVSITSISEDIFVSIEHNVTGAYQAYTAPIVLNELGTYVIRAKTIDSNGTESAISEKTILVKENCYDAPVLSITGDGIDPYYQSASISLTSGTDILYKIDSGAWTPYTTSIELTTDGTYVITYKNDDDCAVESSKTITIDTVDPTNAELVITGDYDGTKFYTSVTTLALNPTEANTFLYYRIHNGTSWSEWDAYTSPVELAFTGNFYIQYETLDQAENSSGVIEDRVRLALPRSETNLYVMRDGQIVNYYNTSTPIELPTSYTEKTEEVRAVWVATVGNIDIGQHTSEASYKGEIIRMLNTIEFNNFNTMFFQVRPMNDAFYESSYAPWSRYLTGAEGGDPGWDVMKFIIEEAHNRGIEVHAWLNPYRVSTSTASKESQLAALHDENWAKQNPDMVIADDDGKLILNPGERQVQVYIRNVIRELISKYDVDGIHFDDYFYSYGGTPLSADSSQYNAQKDPGESLDDWRRDNINTVVREVNEMIEEHNTDNNKTVEFGISPFGIWVSGGTEGSNTSTGTMQSYKDQYADSKKWVEEGWVDYILPQLYWEFDHSVAPFADLVDWWADLCEENDVDLIIGHGFYRYDDDSWDNVDELLEQIRYISQYDSVIGSSFFSFRTLNSSDAEVVSSKARLNDYYWTEYASFPWPSTVEKAEPLVCPTGEHEENGVCVIDDVICPVGEHEENGSCVIDELVCPTGEHEENGSCVIDELVCELGTHEEDGECVVDEASCPVGYERIDGGCISTNTNTGCGSSFGTSSLIVILTSALGAILILTRRKFSTNA